MINEHDINDWVHIQLKELQKEFEKDRSELQHYSYQDLESLLVSYHQRVKEIIDRAYTNKVCALCRKY